MQRPIPRLAVLAALAILAALPAACAKITPVDYTAIDEIPPGSDLLSGEDGEFTLYRN